MLEVLLGFVATHCHALRSREKLPPRADGVDYVREIGPALELPHVKFVYPVSPQRSVTWQGGAVMHA